MSPDCSTQTPATQIPASAPAEPARASTGADTGNPGSSDGHDRGDQPAPRGDAATLAGSATASVSRGATPGFLPPVQHAPVPLSRAAEALERAIELGARQGQSASEARIELSPASLGTVRIHIQRTEDGVIARVVAGHEAAQSFQQNADDLRRSLQSHGINLLRLEIESSGGRGASESQGGRRDSAGSGARNPLHSTDEGTGESSPPVRNLHLSGGGLVDLLA